MARRPLRIRLQWARRFGLSVVIRAANSQTAGAIEAARDAITERLAAIGQPLESLTVQQTGSTTDGTTTKDGPNDGIGEKQSGPRNDPSDPRGARRGAPGF
jgi:hypothetical protein